MRVAVVNYPGSHSAGETVRAFSALGAEAYLVDDKQESLNKPEAVIIPGGYSFGDYLRPGAMAKASPVSGVIRKFAKDGGPILGIGNGFQILCELGLLPGALLVNRDLRFANKTLTLRIERKDTPVTHGISQSEIRLPIACYAGSFWTDKRTAKELETNGEIIFRYLDAAGDVNDIHPYLGSLSSIAGITNRTRNIVGLMPHPERSAAADGALLFQSLLSFVPSGGN